LKSGRRFFLEQSFKSSSVGKFRGALLTEELSIIEYLGNGRDFPNPKICPSVLDSG
jgi:hypothetical protein